MAERQFGPYRLVRQIAVGGMAEIHLAKTRGIAGFEKYVVLKMIHPNFALDEQFIEMLIDEAKIAVQLQHVNVAQTFDLGRVGDTYYITMEFVDGADLYKILRRGSERNADVPLDVCAFVAKEMATGLDYAHRKRGTGGEPLGIVHRDVSPQNVLVSNAGEVKLVDFGIAKATMKARQTAAGVIKGKYYYMSPEQAWGDLVDHRSDIFSAGIVLYEMLTGQMLYLEEDLHRLLDMVRRAAIAPPTKLRAGIPPQLERIVMHALAKRPDDRYQSAGDFAADLERFLHTYSPVFTASKLAAHLRAVLGDPVTPAPAAVPLPRDPLVQTQAIDRGQLLQERSELRDENSVIFRMDDLAAQSRAAGKKRATSSSDATRRVREPARGTPPRREPPDPGEGLLTRDTAPPQTAPAGAGFVPASTVNLTDDDLADVEERTVVSAAPEAPESKDASAGNLPRSRTELFDELATGEFEPTMVQADEDASSRGQPAEHRAPRDPRVPTTPLHEGERGPRGHTEPGRGRPRTTSRAPSHPALAAQTPSPVVSELRRPRVSRRTPGAGAPVARQDGEAGGPGAPVSVLRALVGGDEPAGRGGSVQLPLPAPEPAPPEPAATSTPTPPSTDPGSLLPLAAQTIAPQPLYRPVQTPGPFPAATPSQSLAAVDGDEVPPYLRLGSQTPNWLLRGALAAVLVGGGLLAGLLLLRQDEPVRASLLIESVPAGALVTVDGKELAETTPVAFPGSRPGARHEIRIQLPRRKLWQETVLVPARGGEVRVMAFLAPATVKLTISTTPTGADVYINGQPKGRTPLVLTGLDPETTKAVELRLKDHAPEIRPLDWTRETEVEMSVVLRK